MIRKGDTVRFLNAIGGGVVVRLDEKKGLVYVEDPDGFEIPTLVRDCVVIPSVNEATNIPRKDSSSVEKPVENNVSVSNRPSASCEEPVETAYGDDLKAFLAFFAVDIKQLQTTSYDCYLVNDSNYYLYYNVLQEMGDSCMSFANGLIEPNIQEEIGSVLKEELNDWENVRVQLLPFKKGKKYGYQSMIDVAIKLNVVKFYKLHSFVANDYFDEPAMMIDVVSFSQQPKDSFESISAEELKMAMFEKQEVEKPKTKKISRLSDIIEVDLHINELVDITTGLDNAAILELQLDKFHAILAENKERKGQKIVFIHGKGEGVLRKEIVRLLKTRYKSYYFQDASFREYGFGATMVTIK